MYHQMTLEEFGMKLTNDLVSEQKRIRRMVYASSCGGCICNHCANNVECMDNCVGEAEFGCFDCDECVHFDGKTHVDNWKTECDRYKVTETYVKRLRRNFTLIAMDCG